MLSRTDLLARGKIIRLYSLSSGVTVATFRCEDVLRGNAEGKSNVLVSTTEPGFLRTGDELLLLLRREGDGERFRALDKIDVNGKGGALRAACLRRLLAVEADEDPVEKRVAFKKLLFENLASADRWCRENAVRELYIFTEREPGAFTAEDGKRLAKEAMARTSKTARNHLEYAVAHLEVIPALRKATAREVAEVEAGFGELARLLGDKGKPARLIQFREDVVFQQYRLEADPRRRSRIIRTASLLRRPRLRAGVVKALDDRSVHVRVEALKAMRLLASPYAARRIAEKLEDPFPHVRLEAAKTLGAVGTRAMIPALEKRARDDAEADAVRSAAREAIAAIEAGGG
jgi:hypothetical protein